MKTTFRTWLSQKQNAASASAYAYKIDKISKDLKSKGILLYDSLYEIKNKTLLISLFQVWSSIPKFQLNDIRSHKIESVAFKRYIEFIENPITINNNPIINKQLQSININININL